MSKKVNKAMKKEKNIKVVELFAGVGGFRLGLENSSKKYETIWANQWEPGKKNQHAFNCYISHYGKNQNHINEDISNVKFNVPSHDLLVGGFPCQDYSVARTGAKGIEGKKGVLWWDINEIIKSKQPTYILLENVDRLIKSPGSQRGRDFGVILRCFDDLGYAVEWRVINAADYGQAQRRRRIFIFAYKMGTAIYSNLQKEAGKENLNGLKNWILKKGFYAPEFPVKREYDLKKQTCTKIDKKKYVDLASVSMEFKAALFNSGVMINSQILSIETTPIKQKYIPLKEIISKNPIADHYFLNGSLEKWTALKGAKKIPRVRPNGEPYVFSEGSMCFPDELNRPARTMLTSESKINRSTHVIEDYLTGKLRLLTPEECEKLNGFPEGWTKTDMPDNFRYFVMGNALVVPIVTKIGNRILEII